MDEGTDAAELGRTEVCSQGKDCVLFKLWWAAVAAFEQESDKTGFQLYKDHPGCILGLCLEAVEASKQEMVVLKLMEEMSA